MKIRISALSLLLFCSIGSLYCQPQPLTKQQMLYDLDSLESAVYHYHYNLPLLEQRTGTSVKTVFNELKNLITSETSMFDFVDLVWQGLNALNDGHTGVTNKSSLKWFINNSYLSKSGNAILSDTLYADYYQKLVPDSVYSMSKSGLRAKYIDGKYYNARSFTYEDREIEFGKEITTIDGEDIHDFVNENYTKILHLMWDTNHNRWYSDFFMLTLPYINKKQFTLNIAGEDILIDSDILLENLRKEQYQTTSTPKIYVLNDILYIYMPVMMSWQWYVQEIKRHYNSNIKKIVFDLRGNSGGDDSVWASILKHLIATPFFYQYNVGANYNKTLQESIFRFGEVDIDGYTMTVSNKRIIEPDSSSVNFTGKFYILQDKYTYSAAAAFVSAALQNTDKIVVVGERSALISGYTFPPLIFSLPNSRIAFRLGFSADLTGGKSNPYMDIVNIEVVENPAGYFDKLYKYDCHSKEYLDEVDSLISYIKNDTL